MYNLKQNIKRKHLFNIMCFPVFPNSPVSPHELADGFEVCQMKGTHIGASELTLFKSYEIGLFRIRPLCF